MCENTGRHWQTSGLEIYRKLTVLYKHKDSIVLFIHNVEINIKDKDNLTPLMEACIRGEDIIISRLIQVVGIKLNCQDNNGRMGLHLSLIYKKPNCFKILAEAPGLNWNIHDKNGETPLLMAAFKGCVQSIKLILDLPKQLVDFNVTNEDGYNVALLSILNAIGGKQGDPLKCIELLTADARVNWNYRKPFLEKTPLMYCIEDGTVEMTKMIIINPTVDLNILTSNGKFLETLAM